MNEDHYVSVLSSAALPDLEPLDVIRDGVLKSMEINGNPLDNLTPPSIGDVWLDREIGAHSTMGLLDNAPVNVAHISIPARNRQIPVRIYSPRNSVAKPPLMIYLHGGGWALNSVTTGDSFARYIACKLPAIIVSVDYRLAPEFPFPAAFDDAFLATQWAGKYASDLGADPKRIGIIGDSAGATLATTTALKCATLRRQKTKGGFPNEAGTQIKCQALIYPATDISMTQTPSYSRFGKGYWLTLKAMHTFRRLYLPNQNDWTHPHVSPLLASDEDLKLMPPTAIVTAGCDPLRDEGEAYGKKLHALGVPTKCNRAQRMPHAFLALFNNPRYADASPAAQRVINSFIADVAAIL